MSQFSEVKTMNSKAIQAAAVRRIRRGFTLVELLVVMAIIAILAGLGIPAVMMAIRTSNEFQIQTRSSQMGTAIEAFRNEYSFYPPDHYYDGTHVEWIDPDASNAAALLIGRYGPLLQRVAPNHREFDASAVGLIGGEIPILAWYRARGQYLNPTNALNFWLGGGMSDSKIYPLSEELQRDAESAAQYTQRMSAFAPRVFFDFGAEIDVDPLEWWDGATGPVAPAPATVPSILRSAVQNSTARPYLYFTDGGQPALSYPVNSLFTPYNFSTDPTVLDLKSLNVGETNPVTPAGSTTGAFFGEQKFQLITAGLDEIYGWPAAAGNFPPEFRDDIVSFANFKRADTVEAFGL